MKTVYIKEFGGPENLEVLEIPEPGSPAPGEVLVQVTHAGLNRADILQRRGLYPPPPGYDPRRPGLEFSGRVEMVGEGVSKYRAGDLVCGITAGEAQSEYIVIDELLIVHSPDIDPSYMAAVPEAFVTAHDALVTQAGVSRGETVLIHAAASGVGLAAAQIAKAKGAIVIGTTRSPKKSEMLSAAHSDHKNWIDHVLLTAEGPAFAEQVIEITNGRGADTIIDLVGGAYFAENLKCIAETGRIMLVGLMGGRKAEFDMGVALAKRLMIKGTVLRPRPLVEKASAMEGFRRDIIPGLNMADGSYKPVIDRFFGLNEIADAHRYIEENKNVGKVILDMRSSSKA